jgi:hypothetical protein
MATNGPLDENRVIFLRGVLAALASSGQLVHYDEIRRLCRLNQEQVGEYLDSARSSLLAAGQPDFCAIVVNDGGWPGDGWAKDGEGTNPREWARELREVHRFWKDRRAMDNGPFSNAHTQLPVVPGL